jgi:hypothetical protein
VILFGLQQQAHLILKASMKQRPIETSAPSKSKVEKLLYGADFYDSWVVTSTNTSASALELFLISVSKTPKWVDICMSLRNSVVKAFGLKDLGGLGSFDKNKKASDYKPGERVGIFTLIENEFDEVLLGDDDKHLKVVVSIHRQAANDQKSVEVTITTVVHTKNILGRLYMLPVKPMHRIIAPSMLSVMG